MNILTFLTFFLPGNIWNNLIRKSSHKILKFNILLKQQNIEIIERELIDRSDPYSNNYGKWFTKHEIDDIIKPANYDAVINWLDNSDITCSDNTDNLLCYATEKKVHKLFNITSTKNQKIVYNIPDNLLSHIDIILGMSDDYQRKSFKPISNKHKDPDYIISPESIYKLYNVSYPNHKTVSSQSVVEFLGDSCYNNESLQMFLSANGMSNISIPPKHSWAPCDINTMDPDIEATLDIQYQTGINNNTELYYISVSDWLYQFSNKVYESSEPPKVVSMSYGWAEWDQCDPSVMPTCLLNVTGEEYTRRTNIEFMKLGLRGVTLVASSGDAGAPGRTNEECSSENKLNPAFPASSPWVLAVGGTIFMNATELENPQTPLCKNNSCIGGGVELNCNYDRCGWTSGGGFSNYFNRPPWQVNASISYLNSSANFPPEDLFNTHGRVYPDISLVAHNYLIGNSGSYSTVDGTSASAPSISAMISILNNMRVSNGKSTLGPVAAVLYSMGESCPGCFKDIVDGSNNSTEFGGCKWGYHGAKGYDAVYGLGVPNFKAIYNYVENL